MNELIDTRIKKKYARNQAELGHFHHMFAHSIHIYMLLLFRGHIHPQCQ